MNYTNYPATPGLLELYRVGEVTNTCYTTDSVVFLIAHACGLAMF